ncbi:2-hydroxyacid dehydrogenase [Pelagicoccus sp. SDUM812003]|uniref:2-hydroxyacid dehydrogenase n=1 Tax=Pelagicoccus sp. SDUM812003 TaxID=3041267 RepID=UPI00280EE1E3|nr:2-hydroxyacid dehydrogenase [Pelagicoccus sp. SDUM812003]MDQ8201392.1 2-hydroxyacid dehydrogenase [Pelagicoccus sp. SDUM812003]
MKVIFFSAKSYDREFFEAENRAYGFDLSFIDTDLSLETVLLAKEADAVCAFVNDTLDAQILGSLAESGVRSIALRCAGFNNVDLAAAKRLGIRVGRVPAYSPYAVAEHAVALILALNRKVHRAYNRVRESNFSLEGLMGFDLHGTTVGVIGTGKIGQIFVGIMKGFGCEVLAYDPYPSEKAASLGAKYVSLEELYQRSSIVSLHCPLSPESHHMIDEAAIEKMQDGVMLINTSRGALVDTAALIQGLKLRKIGHVGLDVYEEEADLFFEDLSTQVMQDDIFARLTTFPNVIVTGHQAFLTSNALRNIAQTTLGNLKAFADGAECPNELSV